MTDEDQMIQGRFVYDYWYKPINWNAYSPDQYPGIGLKIIFVGTYAYLRLASKERGRFHFELYDFAQTEKPLKWFSVQTLEGLREASNGEVAESAAYIAKKMIEDSLRRGNYDSFV
jgi:hypothetical protein